MRGLERSISKIFRKVVRIQCEAEDAAAKKAESEDALPAPDVEGTVEG